MRGALSDIYGSSASDDFSAQSMLLMRRVILQRILVPALCEVLPPIVRYKACKVLFMRPDQSGG